MAFRLYKGPNGSTGAPGAERFIASGAVTEGIPVKLVAGASGASLAKVATVAAGSSSADPVYGIPIHSAANGEEVLVIPALPGIVWEVDAAADADVSNAAADNYLAASTYLLTVGASTSLGKKCHIIGMSGKASDRKYLVHINQSAVSGV